MIYITQLVATQLEHYRIELDSVKLSLKVYSDCEDTVLIKDIRKNGRVYYSTSRPQGDKRVRDYVGLENDLVRRLLARDALIEYAQYLESMIEVLSNFNADIDAIKPFKHIDKAKLTSAEERAWLIKQEEYKRKHPPDLKNPRNRVTSDVSARTKAESICISLLEKYGITYIYECPLLINGKHRWPDFLLFINGKVFIWEHLGLIYLEDYFMKQYAKLTDYASIGFYAGTNLFFTFDGPDNTTDAIAIENTLLSIIRIAYA